jgi:hypothetical protein
MFYSEETKWLLKEYFGPTASIENTRSLGFHVVCPSLHPFSFTFCQLPNDTVRVTSYLGHDALNSNMLRYEDFVEPILTKKDVGGCMRDIISTTITHIEKLVKILDEQRR